MAAQQQPDRSARPTTEDIAGTWVAGHVPVTSGDGSARLPTPGVPVGSGVPGLVSVVIPTYNRAHILGKAIASARAQSYRSIEIIVVDDGSTDATAQLVSALGGDIRYLRQSNGGVAAARNRGLRNARGEFIAFLDSDDEWHSWKLAAQIAVLRTHPEVGMVWTDMTAVSSTGEIRSPRYLRTMYSAYRRVDMAKVCRTASRLGSIWPNAPADRRDATVHIGEIYSHMLLGSLVHTSTVVLKREWAQQVGGFDEDMRPIGEDYQYHFKTTSLGPVALIDAPSILFAVGDADHLNAPRDGVALARHNLQTVLDALDCSGDRIVLPRSLIVEHLAECYAWVGEEELRAGNHSVARGHLWSSLRLRPWQPRVAGLFLFSVLPAGAFDRALALRRAWRRGAVAQPR